ncbi:putative GNAT family acetyltransferase [Lachnospiraceae bacterium PF1-21]|uniref:Uncharacterized protein n=1 Tax=Ohessyouella blattaphilus TaxID=2949333 RepID=A0ABT1EFE7_9FIRM|nr:hypothetical protein [Ohessyouella blattaphilus]MCP1109430.1 hypothetical protein [Ohessyouella blattaphilus]MCR8562824.1 hypothetical protein [Ohessyouella blattaphilus]MDL2249265.1 hypothetical protein [Lachnospiraceae bacterium OttesenSCG-928-J05]
MKVVRKDDEGRITVESDGGRVLGELSYEINDGTLKVTKYEVEDEFGGLDGYAAYLLEDAVGEVVAEKELQVLEA